MATLKRWQAGADIADHTDFIRQVLLVYMAAGVADLSILLQIADLRG